MKKRSTPTSFNLPLSHIHIYVRARIQHLIPIFDVTWPSSKRTSSSKRFHRSTRINRCRLLIQILLMRDCSQFNKRSNFLLDCLNNCPLYAGWYAFAARLAHSAKGFNKLLFMRLRHTHSSMRPMSAGTRTAVLMMSSAVRPSSNFSPGLMPWMRGFESPNPIMTRRTSALPRPTTRCRPLTR